MILIQFAVYETAAVLPKILQNIIKLQQTMHAQLTSISMTPSSGVWNFELKTQLLKRDSEEMGRIFSDNHRLNLLSDLLEQNVYLTEKTKTKFSSRSVIPETILDFIVPDDLYQQLGMISLEYDPLKSVSTYLKEFQILTLKPWETWKDLILRQSETTHARIFMEEIKKIKGASAQYVLSGKTEEERLELLLNTQISIDVKEFFAEFMQTQNIQPSTIFEALESQVLYENNLNKIIEVKEEMY